MVDKLGPGGGVWSAMGPCWCRVGGVGVTEGHLVVPAGGVSVGVVGCVVWPSGGCPLLGQGEGGALQQGGLQTAKHLSPHVVNAMYVGWMLCLPAGRGSR